MTAAPSAPPRTGLAWQRTALAALAFAALLVKLGITHHAALEVAAGVVSAAAATFAAAVSRLPERPVSWAREPLVMASLCGLAAVLTLLALLA